MTPIPADTPGVLHGILQGVTAATGTLWSSGSIMVNMYPRVCTPTLYPLHTLFHYIHSIFLLASGSLLYIITLYLLV